MNLGIIGLGRFANFIAESVSNSEGILKIVAACSRDYRKRKLFRQKFDIKNMYEDVEKLIRDEDVDTVIIATPPYLHFEFAKKALLAGKHIFLEKPGGLNPQEIDELIRISEENNLKATIDYVMRRNPIYYILKRLCVSKVFGSLERANLENFAHGDSMPPEHWFWDYKKSGGIWVEHGVHFFDLINWLVGLPDKVCAVNLECKGKKIIDRVQGLALHKDVIVNYYHGFTKPSSFEKTTFYFTFEGAYVEVFGWIPVKMHIEALQTPESLNFVKEILIDANRFLPGIDIKLSKEGIEKYQQGKDIYTHFSYILKQDRSDVYRRCVVEGLNDLADAVEGRKNNADVTLCDAKKSLAVACLMEKSFKKGMLLRSGY